MIELQIEIDQLEALLALLNGLEVRTPLQEVTRLTLQDAHDNAAEQYWTDKWSGL
jgi:hypothetical protein